MFLPLQPLDLVNGCFEAAGAWSAWANFKRLKRDRDVKGIVWQFTFIWCTWGYFNLIFYPYLHQWFSALAGAVLAVGNTFWLILWLNILRERKYKL